MGVVLGGDELGEGFMGGGGSCRAAGRLLRSEVLGGRLGLIGFKLLGRRGNAVFPAGRLSLRGRRHFVFGQVKGHGEVCRFVVGDLSQQWVE